MADQPKPWLIILALQAQLAGITKANGYWTDAGNNIWTEPAQRTEALGISIVSQHIDRWQGERPNKRARDITLTLEAALSTDLDNAHQLAHQLIEDIEVCLGKTADALALPSVPGVKPFQIDSIETPTKPEGLPFIYVVMAVSTGYLR